MMNFRKSVAFFLAAAAATGVCGASASAAETVGAVTDTDITVFIDNCPIESYNYAGNTYLIAEELLNYGFDVVWNAADRTLSIDRKPFSYTVYIGDFVNEKKPAVQSFGYKFPIYSTDIVTYVDGEKADSYNIGGRTVIRADWLQKYGECVYDNSKRRFDVKIIENEVKDYEPAVKTYDGEKDGYPSVGSTETKRGKLSEDGTLEYGVSVNKRTDRFGSYETVTYVNNANGSVYTYNDNFKGAVRYTADYENAQGISYCAFDDSFRYGLVMRGKEDEKTQVRYTTEGKKYLSINRESVERDEEDHVVSFAGTIYKDGDPVYDGRILTDRLVNVEAEYEPFRKPYDTYITYAPGYTDTDGVIYYFESSLRPFRSSVYGGDLLYYRGNVVNGVAHGVGKTYYDGAIAGRDDYGEEEYPLVNEVSKFVVPRAKGGLMYSGEFANNLYCGSGRLYNRAGYLCAEGVFGGGNVNGKARIYQSGILTYIGEMKDGKRNGSGTEYSPKGNPLYEGIYASFVGTFSDDNRVSGTEYNIVYNAEKNLHDVVKGSEWVDGKSVG